MRKLRKGRPFQLGAEKDKCGSEERKSREGSWKWWRVSWSLKARQTNSDTSPICIEKGEQRKIN